MTEKNKDGEKKKKVGRKGKFGYWITDDGLAELEEMGEQGLIDTDIAHNIGIHVSTLYEWKNRFPEIDESLKRGKRVVDKIVENALFENAIGFEYEERKDSREIYPDGKVTQRFETFKKKALPNTTAQIFWLKNRQPELWRDRKETAITGEIDISDQSDVLDKYLFGDDFDEDIEVDND